MRRSSRISSLNFRIALEIRIRTNLAKWRIKDQSWRVVRMDDSIQLYSVNPVRLAEPQ